MEKINLVFIFSGLYNDYSRQTWRLMIREAKVSIMEVAAVNELAIEKGWKDSAIAEDAI